MLTVTELTLDNICQYKHYHVDVRMGLMAICGRNGSGKSTLLRALMYGLTGIVDGGWGTQKNLQRDGTAIPGWVEVRLLDTTGVEYVIKRFSTGGVKFADSVTRILPNGDAKEYDIQEVAVRRETVDKFLEGLYGIPCNLLFQLCWGRQGQIDLLLTSPSAYISSFLANIFNTKHLEQIREKLKAQLDTIAQISPTCIKQLEDDTRERENMLAFLEPEKKRYVEVLVPLRDKFRLSLDALRKDYGAGILTEAQYLQGIKTVEDSLKAEIDREKALSDDIATRSYLVYKQEDGGLIDVEKVHQYLELQNYQGQKALEELNTHINQCAVDAGAAKEKLNMLTKQHEDYLKALKDFRKSDTDMMAKLDEVPEFCDVCGSAIRDYDEYVRHKCKLLTGCDSVEEYDQWVKQKEAEYNKTLEFIETNIHQSEEQYNTAMDDSQQYVKQRDDVRQHLANIQLDFILCEDMWKLGKYQENIEEYRKALESAKERKYLTKEMEQELMEQTKELAKAEAACSESEKSIAAAEARLEILDRNIQRTKPLVEKYEVNKEARKAFQVLRDIFSQHRAQARYFATKIVDLNHKLAHFMEEANMPFFLRLNEQTRLFEFTTDGGFVHPASHLSGAQKNISAVALQMALVETVQPNINLFLFDEPSESLDVENKQIMATMFQRMNRMLPAVGGTMLIVSRDEQLIAACENVLDVTEKE